MHRLSHKYLISLLAILLFIPTLSQSGQKSQMRGERYCEIILGKSLRNLSVYNTVGLNNCPEDLWNKITVEQVKKETGSFFVHLNGPRYWVIDGFENSTLINPAVKTFDGLAMREAGVLQVDLKDFFKSKPYQQHQVKRQTTWVYQADKPVYELIDSQGNVFVMQSFSIQTTAQTESALAQLATKLQLPKGWTFKTGIIKKTETIKAIDNLAIVVQDNFLNTYQKATHDFLQ